MIVKVKVIDGREYEIPINPGTICEQLKSKINDIVGFIPSEQILIFNQKELSNPNKLITYGIKHGSVINLALILKQFVVIVAKQDGKSLDMSVSSEITVQGLKEKISILWNIPIEEQTLMSRDGILESNKRLSDYGIVDNCFITLIPKVPKQQNIVKNIVEIPNKIERDINPHSTIQPIPPLKHPDTSSQNNRLDGENANDTHSNDDKMVKSKPIKVNAKIELNMEDHSSHKYMTHPKPKFVPFQGAGQMLGSPVPKIICELAKSSKTTSISPINVDENKPVTQIQVRLADNSRLVVRLNHNHTVGDLKKHIIDQHSQYKSVNFNLMTFPNKILTDDSITIQEANLLNALIVQRLV